MSREYEIGMVTRAEKAEAENKRLCDSLSKLLVWIEGLHEATPTEMNRIEGTLQRLLRS